MFGSDVGGDQRLRQKAKIFLCYSRTDELFVKELFAGLEACRLLPMLDKNDIQPGEPWEQRISRLIAEADTVVFVLSPASIASTQCKIELDKARAAGKRLLPIVLQAVDEAIVPEEIKRLNYIFFNEANSFGFSLRTLARAVETDLQWVRDHTRLGEVASRWSDHRRASEMLLRGRDLEDAELWLSRNSKDEPQPTALQREYISASRRAASTNQRRLVVGSLFVALVAMVITTVAILNRAAAIRAEAKALEERNTALTMQSHFLADASLRAIMSENFSLAGLLALEGLKDADSADETQRARPYVSDAAAALLMAINGNREKVVLRGHQSSVMRASFSSDGRLLTSSGEEILLWNVENAEKPLRIEFPFGVKPASITGAELSRDGRRVLRTTLDGMAVHEISSGHEVEFEGPAWGTLSPNGSLLLMISASDGRASVIEIDSKKEVLPLETDVSAAAFGADGKIAVTATRNSPTSGVKLHVWDIVAKRLLEEIDLNLVQSGPAIRVIKTIDVSRDNRHIVITSGDRNAVIRTILAPSEGLPGEPVRLWEHEGPINDASFSPDGRLVVTSSSDNTARIWDASNGMQMAILRGHADDVNHASFSPDGRYVATASYDRTARIWAVPTAPPFRKRGEHANIIQSVAISPDGKSIATASNDRTGRVWSLEDGGAVKPLAGHQETVWSVEFDRSGAYVVTASEDGTARIWDANTGAQMRPEFRIDQRKINRASFSPDGKKILAATFSGVAAQWDAVSGELLCRFQFPGSNKEMVSARYRPDGASIAVAAEEATSDDGIVRFLDAGDCKPIGDDANVLSIPGGVTAISFSPDGTKLITASNDHSARIWDLATKIPLAVLKGHGDNINSAEFDASGRWILTTSNDRTARIWDVETGQMMAILQGHADDVNSGVFSPNSDFVVTVSNDKSLRIWPFDLIRRRTEATLAEANKAAFVTAQLAYILAPQSKVAEADRTLFDGRRSKFIAFAKQAMPRCLSRAERASLSLSLTVPAWCKSMQRWPYDVFDTSGPATVGLEGNR